MITGQVTRQEWRQLTGVLQRPRLDLEDQIALSDRMADCILAAFSAFSWFESVAKAGNEECRPAGPNERRQGDMAARFWSEQAPGARGVGQAVAAGLSRAWLVPVAGARKADSNRRPGDASGYVNRSVVNGRQVRARQRRIMKKAVPSFWIGTDQVVVPPGWAG